MNRRLRDGGSSGSEDLVFQNLKEQKKNAQAFIKRWEGRGNERQDSQSFCPTSAQLSRAVKADEISVVEPTQPLRLAQQSKDN